jgi:arylsulfatase A-like enzyme
MKRPILFKLLITTCCLCFAAVTSAQTAARPQKPNILWIVAEDMNDFLSCYGHTATRTPTFDAMSEHGVRFTRFYVTAPVFSSSRSGYVLGAMQTTFNAQHHRSSGSRLPDTISAPCRKELS